jgi:DNA-binding MarR family transcriptional regulator
MLDMKTYDLEFTEPAMTVWMLLRQTHTAVNKVAEVRLAKKGLTPEKAAVLWACRDYPDVVTPAEIARLVFREAQTIAGLLNRMEREGLIKRIPKRKGRPYTQVKLTPKGEELVDPGIQVLRRLIESLTEDMPDKERERLIKSLAAIRRKMMDELHIESGSPPALEGRPVKPW